jgi:hypothetical protein
MSESHDEGYDLLVLRLRLVLLLSQHAHEALAILELRSRLIVEV